MISRPRGQPMDRQRPRLARLAPRLARTALYRQYRPPRMRSQRGAIITHISMTKPERAERQTNVTRLCRNSGTWKYIGVVSGNFRISNLSKTRTADRRSADSSRAKALGSFRPPTRDAMNDAFLLIQRLRGPCSLRARPPSEPGPARHAPSSPAARPRSPGRGPETGPALRRTAPRR